MFEFLYIIALKDNVQPGSVNSGRTNQLKTNPGFIFLNSQLNFRLVIF